MVHVWMAGEHSKFCSIFLVYREMHLQPQCDTTTHPLGSQFKTNDFTKYWWESESLNSHTLLIGILNVISTLEKGFAIKKYKVA